jgi:hypothetical protein
MSGFDCAAMEPADDLSSQSAEQLAAGIEHKHPAAPLMLAQRLFAKGDKDQAVFWFYLGQLRYRAYLAAKPGLDPSGDPAVFASLMEVVGRPINEYAFGDIPALAATIDRVIAWDGSHPDDFAPPAQSRDQVKDGLRKLRASILERRDQIRAERTANGLPNRGP